MPRALTHLIAGLILTTLIACDPTPASIITVTIDGGDRILLVGETQVLTATVTTTGTASTAVGWTSSDTSVATIDANGTVATLTTGTTIVTATSATDPSKGDSITLTVNPPGTLGWTRQFGTSSDDAANGIATDANGNVYTTGRTQGGLVGTSFGGSDAFIRSYDGNGTLRWTRQFGTGSYDAANGIAVDANGNVYASGTTNGILDGTNSGLSDAFVRSYDSGGNLRWTRQFGTASIDSANGIATDADGNVYTTGTTNGSLEGTSAGSTDAFIRSYDSSGNVRWTLQLGTGNIDGATGIVTDVDGNVYIAGFSAGNLEGTNAGGYDAFVHSVDRDGNLRWTRQFGTSSDDFVLGITIDADGRLYTTGRTQGDLEGDNLGFDDAFIRSYDSDGNLRWSRQFGTPSDDRATGITIGANGYVYASGYTLGALEGINLGIEDAFVRSYDHDGNLRWTRQFGTGSSDLALGIATDASGIVFATGYTEGALDGTNAGGSDVFVRQYGP